MTVRKSEKNILSVILVLFFVSMIPDLCFSALTNTTIEEVTEGTLPVQNIQQIPEKKQSSTQQQNNELSGDNKSFAHLSQIVSSANPGKKEGNKESATAMDALSVSIGLIFILLLIFSLAWFLRKMGYSSLSGQGQLKILAALNLGQKEKIALIQVGSQQLLVGITATQINTLYVLDEPLDAIPAQSETGSSNFSKKLTEVLKSSQSGLKPSVKKE